MSKAKSSEQPKSSYQVLVRLPSELAERFGSIVPARNRSRFLVDLLRRELERESDLLVEAARRLTRLESKASAEEDAEWVDAALVEEADPFDAEEFRRQFQEAQSRAGS